MNFWEILLLRYLLKEGNNKASHNMSFLVLLVSLIINYFGFLAILAIALLLFKVAFTKLIFLIYTISYIILSLVLLILNIVSWFNPSQTLHKCLLYRCLQTLMKNGQQAQEDTSIILIVMHKNKIRICIIAFYTILRT